jgi:hypothetical protein
MKKIVEKLCSHPSLLKSLNMPNSKQKIDESAHAVHKYFFTSITSKTIMANSPIYNREKLLGSKTSTYNLPADTAKKLPLYQKIFTTHLCLIDLKTTKTIENIAAKPQ